MIRKEILVVNAVCTSGSTMQPQVILCRIRGDVEKLADGNDNPDFDGRTVKVPAHLFRGNLPMQGEAVKAEFDSRFLQAAGPSYRVLRNAKLFVGENEAE